jgi:hypothetical protein
LQVKEEQEETQSRYKAREASEEAGAGRVTLAAFRELLLAVQGNRGRSAELERLARQFKCDVALVGQISEYLSIPTIREGIFEGRHARVAERR